MDQILVRSAIKVKLIENSEQRYLSYKAIAAKDQEAAKAALLAATSEIDKATTKGVYHKNTASRKISRLSKAVNGIA